MVAVNSASSVLLAVVFLVSSSSKFVGRTGFRQYRASVIASGVPTAYAHRVAVLTTGAEVTVVLLLALSPVLGSTRPGTAAASLLLLWLTAIAVRGARLRPDELTGPAFREATLLLIALTGVLTASAPGDPSSSELALAASSGLVGSLLFANLDQVVDLFGGPARRRFGGR
ncbi:hypothetical protein FB561_3672 [Kribbella amoyensis]|uniref:Methylamine utilisation protein MauE domain-containing protein n=1 Tax=Kribbella amoyensis TaxID=996641 RepID=A0A561BUJ7_9ACTN|nr:MauE/DoxX family redox-associated membrane protein [Kribbella amoyensis]TWD82539.1 hypothetical protein FB561_3672 [Kribbella amoyensis]